MSKMPYAEEILREPEPEGREPWDAWRTAQKYGAPFWQWYVVNAECESRDDLVRLRREEFMWIARHRLLLDPWSLRGKVLDLGCGPVSMLEGHPETEVVAFDPCQDSHNEALPDMALLGQVNNVDYRSCLIQDIAEEDFDLVWCYNVLDHAVDWQDILVHVLRVLKPGGTFLLVVDVRDRLSPLKEVRVCHPLAFTAEALLEAMRAAGFHVLWHQDIPAEYEEILCWSSVAEREYGQ